MSSFTLVSTGANTLSTDINQYANILNGTTNGAITVINATGSAVPMQPFLTSAPVSDGGILSGGVSGDAVNRVILYVRGSDGYGALEGGAGTSITARLSAQSTGWKIDQSLTVSTNLVVSGTTTLGSVSSGAITTTGVTGVSTNNLTVSGAGGSTMYGSNQFSGTGSGTYTHGMSNAPNFVGITQNVGGSTTSVGVDSIGSTTCHVNIFGGGAFVAWVVKN